MVVYKCQAKQQKSHAGIGQDFGCEETADRKIEDEDAQKPRLGSNSDELHVS